MGVSNDWSPTVERRSRRTSCLADALRFQLDACREAEGLAAIVVSDELGFCVSHSGGDGEHAELAAQLPILVGPAGPAWAKADDDASVPADRRPVVVTTFSASGSTLHVGAVESPGAHHQGPAASVRAALDRVASGFSRMLAG